MDQIGYFLDRGSSIVIIVMNGEKQQEIHVINVKGVNQLKKNLILKQNYQNIQRRDVNNIISELSLSVSEMVFGCIKQIQIIRGKGFINTSRFQFQEHNSLE